jgi:hypothetical protein
MSNTQLSLPAGKSDFNFEEAASLLGLSSQELKSFVIQRLGESDTSPKELAKMRFRPADLVLLNVIQTTQGSVVEPD